MKSKCFFPVIVLILLFSVTVADSCTIFRLKAADGSLMVARSMEFGVDLHYDLIVVPRQTSFTSPFPNSLTALHWETKYGYVGVASFGMTYGVSDGMNEKGLSISALWYDNDMIWPKAGPEDRDKALASSFFSDWVLGNFNTVAGLKSALPGIKVFSYVDTTKMKAMPTLHYAVFDSDGGCIVIEFDKGQCNIYDNPMGIMTNAPSFPWQITNLRQYIGMSAQEPKALTVDGLKFNPTGHGQGMMNLPGDYTPPSRFVRLAMLTNFADRQPDAASNLNLSEHIINTFTIPKGIIVDKDASGKVVSAETTQWVTFRDLTNRILYFNTYDNPTLRKIDLKELDFSAKEIRRIAMFGLKETIIDVGH
ncbi:MAG: choloylglycine hydrolase family protein [Bacteroidetes bacterium]|nr:choloylglycine hydrolase family protein [Bacteroidota bacterium]